MSFRYGWAHRTVYSDWLVTWLSPFVEYCQGKKEVKSEYLHIISEDERAEHLYNKWCKDMRDQGQTIKQTVWKLTMEGMLRYGFQLTVVELSTIAAIYSIRLIIDYLHDQKEAFAGYHVFLFLWFNILRLVAILVRNYYDLHVFNFFRFVQTGIQAWIFEDVSKLRLWQKIGVSDQNGSGGSDSKGVPKDKQDKIQDAEAQLINILTKPRSLKKLV